MNSIVEISSESKILIVKEFRDTVRDILTPEHDDRFLLRWLKARDFDIYKAEKMIRESFKWRKKFLINEILIKYTEPEVLQKYKATGVIGFDKDGSIIRVFRGRLDYKVVKSGIHLLNAYQDNYPEALKVAYLVNVPSFFNWVFNIFKPFLNNVTLSKIKIFPVGSYTWKDELLKICDPKILPAFLGGLRFDPDGDPECKTIVTIGGKVPLSYYFKGDDKITLRRDDPEVKFTVIRERSYFDYKTLIKDPGCRLKWEFQTKDCNIRFGVFYKKLESTKAANLDELIAVENVECHIYPESGELHCEKSGEYILHFDNTYSWLTSKQLFFKVQTIKPDENDIKEI